MQSNNQLQNFLSDLISGAQKVGVMWQLAVLVASLGLSWWWLRRAMIRRIAPQVTGRTQDLGTRGTGRILLRGRYRVLFPLFALILLVFGKWALDHWYSTHLLSIAVPLLSALALIRAVNLYAAQGFLQSGAAASLGAIYRLDGMDWTGAVCNGSSAGDPDISRWYFVPNR
ncbi:MAG: hypothetical protein RBS57_15535 [Desulforhabdus sp.]|jgi:hypothetical protein|nr:hypothetical protein [Desulforhabdus sp.]